MNIKVDGNIYNLNIIDIGIEGDFLYKYAERTDDGDFKGELIGFFENQTITIQGDNNSDFVALYGALSAVQPDGTANHLVEVFSPLGNSEFMMYPNKLHVTLKHLTKQDIKWWADMTIKFTAVQKKV